MEEPAHQISIERPHTSEQLVVLQHALEGFKAKYPDATEDELKAFQEGVEGSILSKKPRVKITKKERRDRRQAVLLKVKANEIRTASVRLMQDIKTPTGVHRELCPTGGMTVAYKLVDGKLVVAASICCIKDPFCIIDGRERAVNRFLDGVTLTLELSQIQDVNPDFLEDAYLDLLRKRHDAAH